MSDEKKAGENKSRRSTMGLLLAISGIGGGIGWVTRTDRFDEFFEQDTATSETADKIAAEVANNTTSNDSENERNIPEGISNDSDSDSNS